MRPIFRLIPQNNRKFSYTTAATSTRTITDAINKCDTRKGKITYRDFDVLLCRASQYIYLSN